METTKDEFNIPDLIVDPRTRTQYVKGKFLGKVTNLAAKRTNFDVFSLQGGFARCYELIDKSTNQAFAGKVVPKSLLVKPHQKEKVKQEEKGK